MKTKSVLIEVGESWFDQMTESEFQVALSGFLAANAPCETCGGCGYVPGRVLQWRDDPPDDIGCPECHGQEWQSPLV